MLYLFQLYSSIVLIRILLLCRAALKANWFQTDSVWKSLVLLYFFHCSLNLSFKSWKDLGIKTLDRRWKRELNNCFLLGSEFIPRIVCSKNSRANHGIICNASFQTYSNSTFSAWNNGSLFIKKLGKGAACGDSLGVTPNTHVYWESGQQFPGLSSSASVTSTKDDLRMSFPDPGTWFYSHEWTDSWASQLKLQNSISNSILISNKRAIYLEMMLLHRCVAVEKPFHHSAQQCAHAHLVWLGLWLCSVGLPNKLFSKC